MSYFQVDNVCMDAEKNISNNLTLDELSEVLDSGAIIKARNLLNALYPSEIADVKLI